MSKLILLLFLNLPVMLLHAQDTSLLKAEYLFSFNIDSSNKSKVHSEKMVLFVGKNASHFVAFNILERKRLIDEGVKQGKSLGFSLQDPTILKTNSNAPQIYKFRKEGHFTEVRRFFKNFSWNESLPAFNWAIDTGTAVINGYNCVSATTSFKGRNYKAWFAPDIPIADGPWKFCGLPGLILKITDSKNEVRFELSSLEKARRNDPVIIRLDNDLVATTKKEYDKLVDASYDDPVGVVSGITGRTYKPSSPARPRKRPISGNAIEIGD